MSTVTVLHECVLEFVECLVHQLLAMRGIYPPHLFERSTKYGISLWHSRHPDVNNYVEQVLTNSRPAFEQNLIDQFIFVTYDAGNQVVDHICLDCALPAVDHKTGGSDGASSLSSPLDFVSLEKDFRYLILQMQCQLGKAQSSLAKYDPSSRWELMVTLKPTPCIQNDSEDEIIGATEVAAIETMLRSGQWIEDNSQATKRLIDREGEEVRHDPTQRVPYVIPLCSLQSSPHVNFQINAFKIR